MKISFHYLTLTPSQIIKQIVYREKKAIEDYSELKYNEAFMGLSTKLSNNLPTIENALERVVVKTWGNIISVYPIIVTPYQEYNETWVKHDTRRNSITQNYGSIFVGIKENLLYFELWKGGNSIACNEITIDGSLVDSEELTFQRCLPKNLFKFFQFSGSEITDSLNLDIPLTLPTMWKEIWAIQKQTKFTSFCQ